jgi:hypothetical protein
MSVFGFLLMSRNTLEAKIMRVPGTLFQRTEQGMITNMFNIQIINKTNETQAVELTTNLSGAIVRFVGESITLKPQGSESTVFFVDVPQKMLEDMKTDITFVLIVNGKEVQSVKNKFIGPTVNVKP